MRIAIDIDGVLRDTYEKIEQIYQKFFIDELELVDEDFQFDWKQEQNQIFPSKCCRYDLNLERLTILLMENVQKFALQTPHT